MGAAISYKYTNNYSKLHSKRTMTVVIDENITDPATCCTYEDDAVGMPSGKSIEATNVWQEFFGYKPCLFKNGQVVGYLNPNDYSKFEDGSSADITSGSSGDVMIEFPKRGLKISKTTDDKLRVSITDNIEDQTYTYYAFTRDKLNYSPFNHQELKQVDKFYLGVYPSYYSIGGELQSKSGYRANTTNGLDEKYGTYGSVENYAHDLVRNKGTGYELMTFFQLVYISGQIWVSKYNAIYGSFAALPLLLLWLQLSWLICLFGAELSYASQNVKKFSFERDSTHISRRYKDFLTLLIATLIIKRFAEGGHPYTADKLSVMYKIPIRITTQILYSLTELGIISEVVIGNDNRIIHYQPAIDINKISVGFLFDKIDRHGSENFKIDTEKLFHKEWRTLLKIREDMIRSNDKILLKDL